jgi:hypothetical protein
MPIYASVETSAGNKKCEFFAKTVILEQMSAYVILMCYKKSRTPWRWRRKTPKRVGFNKLISLQKSEHWLLVNRKRSVEPCSHDRQLWQIFVTDGYLPCRGNGAVS